MKTCSIKYVLSINYYSNIKFCEDKVAYTQTIRGSLSFGFLGVAYISNLITQNLQNVIYLFKLMF